LIIFRKSAEKIKVSLKPDKNNSGTLYESKGKGKAIPLQAWAGPEVSRRLRLPDFKTVGT
jgi:hypothetical protein